MHQPSTPGARGPILVEPRPDPAARFLEGSCTALPCRRGVGSRRGGVARHSCRRHAAVPVGRDPAPARRHAVLRRPLPRVARRLSQRAEGRAARQRCAGRACGVIAVGAARRGVRSRARGSREAGQVRPAAARRRWRSTATRSGRRGCSRRPRAKYKDALGGRARAGARPPRHGARARGAQPARRGDGRGAGGAAAVAARSRDPPHRRRDLRAACTSTRRRPAPTPTTSTCCRTRTTARRPTGRAPEIRFLRSFGQRVPFEADPGTDDQLYTVDFRLVNEKVVVRAKVNDARGAGLRRRHRLGEHRHHAADRAAARRHADHLHAQRRRRRRRAARPAAGAHRLARARDRSSCATSRA